MFVIRVRFYLICSHVIYFQIKSIFFPCCLDIMHPCNELTADYACVFPVRKTEERRRQRRAYRRLAEDGAHDMHMG